MKNLNIYTWRELIKMYIDERPMPDVAFVTQTDAMKLQSMSKEENEGWITDRLPTESECTNEGDVWVYLEDVDEYVIRNRSHIDIGDPWREIDPPTPYVKPKRWVVVHWRYSNYFESTSWLVRDTKTGVLSNIDMDTEELALKFASFLNEVMP